VEIPWELRGQGVGIFEWKGTGVLTLKTQKLKIFNQDKLADSQGAT